MNQLGFFFPIYWKTKKCAKHKPDSISNPNKKIARNNSHHVHDALRLSISLRVAMIAALSRLQFRCHRFGVLHFSNGNDATFRTPLKRTTSRTITNHWLVVYTPLWKIWVRQLGWWFPIYRKIIHSCSSQHQPGMIYGCYPQMPRLWPWISQKLHLNESTPPESLWRLASQQSPDIKENPRQVMVLVVWMAIPGHVGHPVADSFQLVNITSVTVVYASYNHN